MATFTDMIVTNKGKIQYAKAMAGKTINFTRVSFGGGKASSLAEAETYTDLKDAVISGSIDSIDTTTEAGIAIVTAAVNNKDLKDPLGIREIGIFNTDPDTGAEVMYAYCYSENDIDVIPSSVSGSVIWKIMIKLSIQNASGATTTQSEFFNFSATGAGTLSTNSVDCRYRVSGKLCTVFYKISGVINNAEEMTRGCSIYSVSIPKPLATELSIYGSAVPATALIRQMDNAPTYRNLCGYISGDKLYVCIHEDDAVINGSYTIVITANYEVA